MSPDLQELEAKLHALRPAALDAVLSARLADSARGTLATLNPAETEFEASLRRFKPAPLSAEFTASILRQTSAPQPNVVAFPAAAPAAPQRWSRFMLPIAAAVALLGAAAALLVPTQPGPGNFATTKPMTDAPVRQGPVTAVPNPPRSSDFVPASISTDLSHASDEGVLWQAPNQPRRVVKVTYRDRVTLIDRDGRKVEVDQPRVEYILVPEKLD